MLWLLPSHPLFALTYLSYKWPCWLILSLQSYPASSEPGLIHRSGSDAGSPCVGLIFSPLKLESTLLLEGPTRRTWNVKVRGHFLKGIVTPGREKKFFFFPKSLISVLHLSTHLPSGNTVSSPFPNSSLSHGKTGQEEVIENILGDWGYQGLLLHNYASRSFWKQLLRRK